MCPSLRGHEKTGELIEVPRHTKYQEAPLHHPINIIVKINEKTFWTVFKFLLPKSKGFQTVAHTDHYIERNLLSHMNFFGGYLGVVTLQKGDEINLGGCELINGEKERKFDFTNLCPLFSSCI